MAVVVRDERTVPVRAERQRQAIEGLRRAVPGEAVAEHLDPGFELRREAVAHQRIRAVGADDEVGVREFVERGDRAP